MEIVRTTFGDRIEEIETYYSFLVFLENGLSNGSTNLLLNDDRYIITPQLQKTVYANVYLHLYNLVESTVSLLLKAVEKKIQNDVRENGVIILKPEIRKQWIIYMTGTHETLVPETRLEKALTLCDHFIDNIPFELVIPKGGGGNWDNENIRLLAQRMGFSLTIPRSINTSVKRPVKDNRGVIQLITYTRNKLAHGEISFSECGNDLTLSGIEQLIEITKNYLDAVITCFDDYLNSGSYRATP
ncbi:MAG: MAE_28990/MAE_18760 family HEPN-like nuclease [Acinetobacter sp.]